MPMDLDLAVVRSNPQRLTFAHDAGVWARLRHADFDPVTDPVVAAPASRSTPERRMR
ncbi:MAG: hypothetical protein ACREIT_09425 [Tepidisphaeraceae bacterium]